MEWIGSPEFQLSMILLWSVLAVAWLIGYFVGEKTRTVTALWVGNAAGWIAYYIEEVGAFLSLPTAVISGISLTGAIVFVSGGGYGLFTLLKARIDGRSPP